MELILIAAFGSLALLVGEIRDYVRRDRATDASPLRFDTASAPPERAQPLVESFQDAEDDQYEVAA